jgi:hypothetical protein
MYTLTSYSSAKINGDVALTRRVCQAANEPLVWRTFDHDPGYMCHIRDGMVAVVDPESAKIIAFYESVV